MKKKVYFNEFNVLMDNAVYLPLVSGLLQAYAQTDKVIDENYQFMPFNFMREELEGIVEKHKDPEVAAFSVSMWNANLSLAVAKGVKEKFPECLVIFGGPQPPFDAGPFLKENPFIDITARGEGEKTFREILRRNLETKDFGGIPGISYKGTDGKVVRNNEERQRTKNLDEYPSPYITGVFDEMMMGDRSVEFQAIIETNRGCPFNCSFCYWGEGGLAKKFSFFGEKKVDEGECPERISQEIEWLGRNGIGYVFCADSNFGMFARDVGIARKITEVKKEYNFPEKFRVCYGKNAEDTIFKVGRILHEGELEKGITLSRQSNNEETLRDINRKNIKMSTYRNLQEKYTNEGIPIYTEFILGLPSETYESFIGGLEEVLQAGMKDQVYVYHCQVLPNTELADKEYMKKHGISTVQVPLNEVHAAERPKGLTTEYEEIITSTNAMPVEDWERATLLSWTMQLFHGLKTSFYISSYLTDRHNVKYTEFFEYISQSEQTKGMDLIGGEIRGFHESASALRNGKSRCKILGDFSPIYWEPEEASYLNISNDKEKFYGELLEAVKGFLSDRETNFDERELTEIVNYQQARFSDYKPITQREFHFELNVPEYFEGLVNKVHVDLREEPQTAVLDNPRDYSNDKKSFAKENLLFGRKSNRIVRPIIWHSKLSL